MSSRQGEREVHLGGRCALSCVVCDCRAAPSPRSDVEAAVAGRAARLVVRGAADGAPGLARVVAGAHAAGSEVLLRTHGLGLDERGMRRLVALGVDALVVPLHSPVDDVHDLVAGRIGAARAGVAAIEGASAAGLAVELEITLLAPHLQPPEQLSSYLERFAVRPRSVRFVWPLADVGAALTARPWAEGGGAHLASLVRAARASGVEVELSPAGRLPLCAPFGHEGVDIDAPGRALPPSPGCERPATPCGACAVAARCGGVARSYLARHGTRGLTPSAGPASSASGRRVALPTWSAERIEQARSRTLLVLRPTVHCNQDCSFCSANETTPNVWADPTDMLRAIVRAGERGIQHLSFSGGEPTLSPHLPSFVAAARAAGIARIEVVTNGVLLDREARVEALRIAGLTHAFVSLHAHEESVSAQATRKRGDFARTVRAIELLRDAGIDTSINHVVHAGNHASLSHFVRFVHERFGPRITLSFAFVTPQFKALEDARTVPRLSDAAVSLRRAGHLALALGQRFHVGSRQGMPPCVLGELAPWSDVLDRTAEAAVEDAPQKVRAPGCDTCLYSRYCTGVWSAYAARYGLDELVPVPGPRIEEDERRAILASIQSEPTSFAQAHPRVRRTELEDRPFDPSPTHIVSLASPAVAASPLEVGRSRPVRALLVGSGARAKRLLVAAHETEALLFEAVASPNAPEAALPEAGLPRYRDALAAMEELRPELVVVASHSDTHVAFAAAALELGVPVLVEKPLAPTVAAAARLVEVARRTGTRLLTAYQLPHAPGLSAFLARSEGPLRVVRRVPYGAPEALDAWSRDGLRDVLEHLLSVVVAARGRSELPLGVASASFAGTSAPTRIAVRVAGAVEADVVLELGAPLDELLVARADDVWRRQGATIRVGGRELERSASDVGALLAAAARVVTASLEHEAACVDGLAVLSLAEASVDALAAAGAPFARAGAPRRVASRPIE